MMKYIARMILLIMVLGLTSCGGGSGGGMAEFATVSVVANAESSRLESDVRSGNTCPTPTPADGTFTTDLVKFTIKSTAFPQVTNAKPVHITGYTVSFAPTTTSTPALTGYSITNIGYVVAPGGSLDIDVPVATDILKYSLVNQKGLQLCSATYYEYYVTVTFSAQEEGTWTSKNIVSTMNVAFADRAS